MYGSPLHEFITDLALARGAGEADESRAMRRRIATILWALLLAPIAYLGGWTNSALVGVGAFIAVVAALWIYAEYGDRLAARLRGRSD